MIVGSGTFDLDHVAPSIRRAVHDACAIVVDEAFNSLEALAEGGTFDSRVASPCA
jgi:hypothetical protein